MSRSRGHLPYGRLTWMLQIGHYKGTECNEMRNFVMNVIVETRVNSNKEQIAFMDYGNHFFHPTSKVFFLCHPLKLNWFNRYRKYWDWIGSLLTSIDIVSKLKSSINPTLTRTRQYKIRTQKVEKNSNPPIWSNKKFVWGFSGMLSLNLASVLG